MIVRYRNVVWDSARWEHLVFRDDDIIISTPPKCGTTWTQMLCALLVFDATEFDRPLAQISPWLDMQTRTIESVIADLEAQTHRRFIKTHTPLDGLPWDDRVTYLCVGRDPRDVALSWQHHFSNMDLDALIAERTAAVGFDDLAELAAPPPPVPEDPIERFWQWATDEVTDGVTLARILAHLRTFWERRHEPNVALFHYSDLSTDLVGQLRRLAAVVGIDRSDERLAELAQAATFDAMKRRADHLAPNADQGFWRSTEAFFHRGSSGQWRDLLGDDDIRRYEARIAEVAPSDFAAWVHHGWLGQAQRLEPETAQ